MHASVPISRSAAWQSSQFSTPGAASSTMLARVLCFGEPRSGLTIAKRAVAERRRFYGSSRTSTNG